MPFAQASDAAWKEQTKRISGMPWRASPIAYAVHDDSDLCVLLWRLPYERDHRIMLEQLKPAAQVFRFRMERCCRPGVSFIDVENSACSISTAGLQCVDQKVY
jgi:hypothetical protein